MNLVKGALILIALCVGLSLPAWAVGSASQLIVQVDTDKPLYQSGETVSIFVRTFLDGQPVRAKFSQALMTVTLPDGRTIRSDLRPQFRMISPGVFVATGVADGPGVRELEVEAVVKARVTCRCKRVTFKSTGFVRYAVEISPLEVGLSLASPASPTLCDVVKLALALNRPAGVRLFAVYPNGGTWELVIPGWLSAGERWIKLKPGKLMAGPVTLKVVAQDKYGQSASASVELTVSEGVCQKDC